MNIKRQLQIAMVAALVTTGCVRKVRVTSRPSTPVTQTVWERQVRNAHDAGEGDYELRKLREKVAADADNVAARMELAKAYRARGFADVALEICRLAAERFPESGEVRLGLVQALRDMNQRNEAILRIVEFLNKYPQMGAEYYSWLGILLDETKQWTAGEAPHRDALARDPKSDALHNNLGYNLLMQNRNAEAALEFREALKLNPASQMARNNLGLALAGQDASKEAIANWQAAADAATAHNNLAVVLMEKGNFTEARKELEIALSYNRAFPAALRNLELVSQIDGNPIALQVRENETRWERWKVAFRRLFVGPLNDARAGAEKLTPAPANGEER